MTFNISHKCIKVREEVRTDVITVKMIINQETEHLVETEIHLIEEEEVLVEIIDQITEVDHGVISERITDRTIIGMTTDKIIIEITTGKTTEDIVIEIKGLEIGVLVGIVTKTITEIAQERTVSDIENLGETEVGKTIMIMI